MRGLAFLVAAALLSGLAAWNGVSAQESTDHPIWHMKRELANCFGHLEEIESRLRDADVVGRLKRCAVHELTTSDMQEENALLRAKLKEATDRNDARAASQLDQFMRQVRAAIIEKSGVRIIDTCDERLEVSFDAGGRLAIEGNVRKPDAVKEQIRTALADEIIADGMRFALETVEVCATNIGPDYKVEIGETGKPVRVLKDAAIFKFAALPNEESCSQLGPELANAIDQFKRGDLGFWVSAESASSGKAAKICVLEEGTWKPISALWNEDASLVERR